MEKKIIDTLNGALNKLLIDGYVVIRESDGHILSDHEIMELTRPFFLGNEGVIHDIENMKPIVDERINFKELKKIIKEFPWNGRSRKTIIRKKGNR